MSAPSLSNDLAEASASASRAAGDSYRFYVPDLRVQVGVNAAIELPADQAHHAAQVLRLAVGEAVVLFDGQGAWAQASLKEVAKKGGIVTAAINGSIHVDPPPKVTLTIATAVPKGERAEWLVEQASQLNVSIIAWLSADRGVVKPRGGGGKMEKWRRLAIESAKQCERTHFLQIREPASLEAIIGAAMETTQRILWLEPREGGSSIHSARIDKGNVIALVGPEGGWSDREFTLLESHVAAGRLLRIRLTPTVLRIETACAAIAAVLMSG